MDQQGPYHNSPVLNEIHRYFPALLYNNEDFTRMADVFGYVRNQMRTRFDTYSNLREQHRSRRPQRRNNYNSARYTPPVQSPPVTSRSNTTRIVVNELDVQNQLNNIVNNMEINRLFYSAFGIHPGSFNDPVLIVPTPEQIDTGSVIQNMLTPTDVPCSICQDVINGGDEVRRLNHCHHIFHRNCIDTWYQRNVRCPVCRHDIRTTSIPQASTV